MAWLRIIPNEPATISESDATCLHARRVSLSFSLPPHFRRLFSCCLARVAMYIDIRDAHTRVSSGESSKFRGPRTKGALEEAVESKGRQCAHVSSGERAREEERDIRRDRGFPWDRWAGEQQVVPENGNHAAGTRRDRNILRPYRVSGGSEGRYARYPFAPSRGKINLLEISRLWMEETFNGEDPFERILRG